MRRAREWFARAFLRLARRRAEDAGFLLVDAEQLRRAEESVYLMQSYVAHSGGLQDPRRIRARKRITRGLNLIAIHLRSARRSTP